MIFHFSLCFFLIVLFSFLFLGFFIFIVLFSLSVIFPLFSRQLRLVFAYRIRSRNRHSVFLTVQRGDIPLRRGVRYPLESRIERTARSKPAESGNLPACVAAGTQQFLCVSHSVAVHQRLQVASETAVHRTRKVGRIRADYFAALRRLINNVLRQH